MKASNWAVVTIILAILIGCAGGGTSTFVERPGLGQPIAGIPESDSGELRGSIPLPIVVGPVEDQGSEGHPGLPGFPGSGGDVFSPVHMVSEAEYKTLGDGFVNSFGANNRPGIVEGEYVLIPEEGDIAWAIYSIPDLTGDRPVRVDVAVTPAELEAGSGENLLFSYWIGVADYTLYHWDWYGPFIGPQEVVINSDKLKDRYVSETGTLHWVAVLYGDEPDGLPGLTLQSGTVVTDPEYIANKPHYTGVENIGIGGGGSGGGKGASALDQSQFVTIHWDHVPAFGPNDTQNEAYIYQVFRLGPVDAQPANIGSLLAPDVTYVDPTDNPSTDNEPIPGAEYRYYLRAVNQNGFTPLSVPKEAEIPFFAPTGLAATDGDPSDRVTLSWQAAEGAASYEVYRNIQDAPIATVNDEDAIPPSPAGPDDRKWNDYGVPDFTPQTYWLKAVNQYATSEFSLPETGYITADPVAGLSILPGQESGTAPHLVNFDASASNDPDGGDIVTYDWDWEGDGTIDEPAGPATIEHTYFVDGSYNPTVKVTDDEGDSAEASIAVSVNEAPVADLQADPITGEPPLSVNFDASGSTDNDGTIVQYEWDWDSDGTYDHDTGSEPTTTHEYTDAGTYTATVRVTDDDGGTDTAQSTEIVVLDNQQGDWWMFGRDAKHNRRSTYNGPATNALDWTYTTGEIIMSSPAIDADGTIYVGSQDYKLYAINPDVTEKWTFTTGGFVISSPAIGADGTVYVGSGDFKLYAINSDGTEKWTFTTGDTVWSSPAIANDRTIYVGSYDNKLYAINPDGSLKWSFTTGLAVYSSPAIGGDGTVFVGSNDNNLYAINPDGSEKWTFATGDIVQSSPALGADGTVYVGSLDGNLYAINPDGSQKWSYTTGSYVYSSPAIGADGTVYVVSYDNNLYAINPDGSLKWSHSMGAEQSSAAIGTDGTLYVGGGDGNLYAMNPDGSLEWSYSTGGDVRSSPAIANDGTLYVGSYDNKLYAFNTNPGDTAPTADLQANPTYGLASLTVDFDASGSTDDDGTIVKYEFDFDEGAGWEDFGTNSTPQNEYQNAGTYNAQVRVTDDDGASDTALATVEVYSWQSETVDSTDAVGEWSSLAIDSSGYSHISYRDDTNDNLKYAYYNGTWSISTVDNASDVGVMTSIAMDSADMPHISYNDWGNMDLKYAYWNGSTWDRQTVDSTGNVGQYTSIAIDTSNYPHISYFYELGGNLKYARYDGGQWNTVTVHSDGDTGRWTSLALDDSNLAHISYYMTTPEEDLWYAHYNGTSWDKETVDTQGNMGDMFTSLALDSFDQPHISYVNQSNMDLKHAFHDGGNWVKETVDSEGDVGSNSSLAIDSLNRLHICYRDYSNTALKYAFYNGTSWQFWTVDSGGNVGVYNSLELDSAGLAHVSYWDQGNLDLKYAHWVN